MKFTIHGNFFPTESTSFNLIGPDKVERDISYENNGYTAFLYLDEISCPLTGNYYIKVYNSNDNTFMHFINPLYITRNDDFYYSPRYFSDATATGYISVYKNAVEPPSIQLIHDESTIYPTYVISIENQHVYKFDIEHSPSGVYDVICDGVQHYNNLYIYEDGKQLPIIVFNPKSTVKLCDSFIMYFNGFHLDMMSVIWFERESDGYIYTPEIVYMFKRMIRLKCDNLPVGKYTMYASYEDRSIHQGISVLSNFIEVIS